MGRIEPRITTPSTHPVYCPFFFVPCCNRNLLFYEVLRKWILPRREQIFIFSMIICTRHGRNLSLYYNWRNGSIISSDSEVIPRFPQKRIISFKTHSWLVNDPNDWIYMLIPRGNIQMIVHRMTIHLLYLHSNRGAGKLYGKKVVPFDVV